MNIFLGISVALASFLVVGVVASLLARGIGAVVAEMRDLFSARTFSQITFALRVWPIALSIIIVVGLIVPSFVLFEPDTSDETVTVKLGLPAMVALAGIFLAVYRTVRTIFATTRLSREWYSSSKQIAVRGIDEPIYKFEHRFPVLAVVGIIRPRIFVASQVLKALTDEELRTALEHERGHILSRDNLKKVVIDFCRSVILFPLATSLRDAWAEASEQVADQHAVTSDPSRAADLASALIKIARIAPGPLGRMPLAASVMISGSNSSVAERISRLLKVDGRGRGGSRFKFPSSALALTAALVIVLAVNIIGEGVLQSTHGVMENLVQFLQ